MPDTRSHRGPHPNDPDLFAPAVWPRLQAAVGDYSWLLTRGYAEPSAIKIVGDRYELDQRQRMAIARGSCADDAMRARLAKQVSLESIAGEHLYLDGFNILTTIEVALGGGVVLAARDGCYRDIASVHGTYRKVEETTGAIEAAGATLAKFSPTSCTWYLDSPVGNSGHLKQMMLEIAGRHGWPWTVELVASPDSVLAQSEEIIATADSVILDRCRRWVNLAKEIIGRQVSHARVIPMAAAQENSNDEIRMSNQIRNSNDETNTVDSTRKGEALAKP